jgi:hypothetical protein
MKMMSPRAMITPVVDVLCVGGASIIAMAAILIFGTGRVSSDLGWVFAIGILLNWPHFIASYRLLYATRESVRAHRVTSTWLPALLAGYALLAIVMSPQSQVWGGVLFVAGGLYLARHYTGQTWGMMASFSHVEDAGFVEVERRLIRGGLNLLMLWHVAWAADQSIGLVAPSLKGAAEVLYERATAVALAGFALGLCGLVMHARRRGRLPPLRVWVPWVAVHSWYVVLSQEPTALLVVQGGHALQYLMFPMRVEMNRSQRETPAPVAWKVGALGLVSWTVIGLAVFEGAEPLFRLGYQAGGGQLEGLPRYVAGLLIASVALHHYFIDGALYKLRNPEVRRDLFAHLPRSG